MKKIALVLTLIFIMMACSSDEKEQEPQITDAEFKASIIGTWDATAYKTIKVEEYKPVDKGFAYFVFKDDNTFYSKQNEWICEGTYTVKDKIITVSFIYNDIAVSEKYTFTDVSKDAANMWIWTISDIFYYYKLVKE